MAISCRLDKERYVLGSDDCVTLRLDVSSNYNVAKTLRIDIGVCVDQQCNTAEIVSRSDTFEIKANQSGYVELNICGFTEAQLVGKLMVICVYNVTDNKYECCDTFVVVTQLDEMINSTMSMIPMMLMLVVVSMVIGFIPKITESLKR